MAPHCRQFRFISFVSAILFLYYDANNGRGEHGGDKDRLKNEHEQSERYG